jgi:hypothetical protein
MTEHQDNDHGIALITELVKAFDRASNSLQDVSDSIDGLRAAMVRCLNPDKQEFNGD